MDLLTIAQNVRKWRIARRLTVEQLAARSGFSKGFISQIENFRTTPSLKAVNRIAEVLAVPVAELFTVESAVPEYSFGRLDRGDEINRDDSARYGMCYRALAIHHPDRELEPFTIEYTPSDEHRGLMMHDSEEFFAVLEGEVDFHLVPEASPRRMTAGDTVYLRANLPHKAELAPGCPRARALVVYSKSGGKAGREPR